MDPELSRRRFLRYAAALGVTGPTLAACGASEPVASPTAPTAMPAATATPVPTATADPTATAVPDATATPAPEPTAAAEALGVEYDASLGYWRQGGFLPVTDELTESDLVVRGSIPAALNGLYVRNGTNAFGENAHWFFGEGMVHGIEFDNGKAVTYRNRFVKTPVYEAAAAGTGDTLSIPGQTNTQSNVSVVSHGGKLWSLGEIGWPFELDPSDLSTIGAENFGGALGNNLTAHPKVDPATGLLHAFGYGVIAPPFLTYYVISADGTEIVHASPVELSASTMIHDFAITDRDVIFWEGPVLFDLQMAMSGQPIPYRWDPGYGARIGIMPLGGTGDQIQWAEVDPMFIFHGSFAHRDGDDIVLYASRLPDFFSRYDGLDGPSLLTRFTINTAGATPTVNQEVLLDLPLDLPSYDRRYLTEAPNNAWYVTTEQTADGNIVFDGITGYDFSTGSLDRWISGPDLQPNEALFVPASDTADRNDGWLLSYAWDRAKDRSELVILDTSDIAGGPIAAVELPQRVPFGFHAAFHR